MFNVATLVLMTIEIEGESPVMLNPLEIVAIFYMSHGARVYLRGRQESLTVPGLTLEKFKDTVMSLQNQVCGFDEVRNDPTAN